MEKKIGKSIDGDELLKIIYSIQEKNPSIFIYNIHKSLEDTTQNKLISFDYLKDLSILENTGRIKIHKSEPLMNITLTGSLSVETLQIPEEIKKLFMASI